MLEKIHTKRYNFYVQSLIIYSFKKSSNEVRLVGNFIINS